MHCEKERHKTWECVGGYSWKESRIGIKESETCCCLRPHKLHKQILLQLLTLFKLYFCFSFMCVIHQSTQTWIQRKVMVWNVNLIRPKPVIQIHQPLNAKSFCILKSTATSIFYQNETSGLCYFMPLIQAAALNCWVWWVACRLSLSPNMAEVAMELSVSQTAMLLTSKRCWNRLFGRDSKWAGSCVIF